MAFMIRRSYRRKRLADLVNLARTGVKSGAVITPSSPAVPRGDPLNLAADCWRVEISLLFAVSIWLPQSLKARR